MDRREWDKHVASVPDRLWKRKKKEPAYDDGRRFGAWLERHGFIYPECFVLDFGCHYGRIAIGLHDKVAGYIGVDVLRHAISACSGAFRNCENMKFLLTDSYNKIYNPKTCGGPQCLDVPSGCIDLAIAISVFPHQEDEDEAAYHFKEIARTVATNGALMISWNGSPLDNSDRKKFFRRDFVMGLYRDAGIAVTHEIDNFNLATIDEVDPFSRQASAIHAGQTLLIGRKIA